MSNVAFAADGTTLTLTLSTGGMLSASVPAALRQAGLSQSQVQALIDAAEADDIDAADVAAQIATELAAYRQLPGIINYNQNTIIPASSRGWTYRATGNTTRLLSIPNASGVGEVPDGWEFVASNGSSADQSISPNGSDTIGGNAGLTLAPGRAVRLQKVATGAWIIIADTKDETGSTDLPTVVNVSADTAIPDTAFGDTYRVTGNVARTITLPDPDDVALGWFVRIANGSGAGVDHNVVRQGAGQSIEGGPGPLAVRSGESVTIQKVNTNEWELIADTSQGAAVTGGALSLSTALTAAQRKAWRNHFGSSRIFQVANALPAIADYNTGDTIVVGRGGATVTSFRDISDASTELTDTVAGDVMMLLAVGWVRIGNFFSGGIAAAAARAIADANKAVVDRLPIFVRVSVNPQGIPDANPPAFITLTLDGKLTDRTITQIQCSIEGQNFANIVRNTSPTPPATDPAAPFNLAFNAGGVVNGSFTSTQRDNLATQAGLVSSRAAQALQGQIRYSFTEGPDQIDYFEFGVQNTAFRPLVVDNIVRFDATANRFEDSENNRVYIPEGADVYLTQAIYDAAVADAQFTPNPKATFITPNAIYYGGQRYGRQRERFETAVGASASAGNVPVGTHTIEVEVTEDGVAHFQDYPLSRLGTSRRYSVEMANPNNAEGSKDLYMNMTYVASTRTLTYSLSGSGGSGVLNSIRAIGEA